MSSQPWEDQPSADPTSDDICLFTDVSDSNNSRRTTVGDFSRLQNAANPYDNLLTYKVGDFVEFNNTIFRNTTAVTVAEDFDPAKWTEVNGASNVVHVRNTADFPDRLVAAFTGFTDEGGMVARFTAPGHGYTQGQTVEIVTDGGSTIDGFHTIDVINVNTFDITLTVAVPAPDSGNAERSLALDTHYILDTTITTSAGYLFVDPGGSTASFSKISSSYIDVNVLLYSGTGTLFTGKADGLQLVLRELTIIGVGPAPTSATLFDLDGVDITNPFFADFGNVVFVGFQNLGTIKNMILFSQELVAIIEDTGFVLENAQLSSVLSAAIFNKAGTPSTPIVLFKITNLIEPFPLSSLIFNLRLVTASDTVAFDIDPSTPTANRVTIIDSGPATPGQYFKNGTELRGAITVFADTTAATQPITGATGGVGVSPTTIQTALTTGIETGDTVTITGTTSYNGTFVISNLIVNTSFEIDLDFVADEAGTWTKVATLVTSTAHNLVTGNAVDIENTINYNQTFAIVVKDANTFTIGIAFDGDDGTGDWTQVRLATMTGVEDGFFTETVFSGTGLTTFVSPNDFKVGDSATIINSIAQYNGVHTVTRIDRQHLFFELDVTFTTDETGNWQKDGTDHTLVSSPGHGLSNGDHILIDETINYDGGFAVFDVTTDTFEIITPFIGVESGVWRDGSLTQRDLVVVLSDVQGLADSASKAGYFTNLNTTQTTISAINVWVDLNLGTVKESSLNQRWRVTDPSTGKIQLRSEEPFEGSFLSTLVISKPGGGQKNYKLRAAKNGGPMRDVQEFSLDILTSTLRETSTNFDLQAEELDDVTLQILQTAGGAENILVTRISSTTAK